MWPKASCIAIVCLTFAWTAPAHADDLVPPSAVEVQRMADEYLRVLTASGSFSGSVLLARDGEPLFVKGYGYANQEQKTPNTAATRFPIASITQTFTAALVMKMQQRGLLSIADPIRNHLPWAPPAWKDITVRHLLMHTSGIPDFARGPEFFRNVRTPRSLDEVISTFRNLPLEFPPGSRYRYSNCGYFVLGALLEKVGGRPYQVLLDEIILRPLDLRDTGYGANLGAGPRDAIGYRPDGADNAIADFIDTSWLYACGGMHSTVEDLLKWDRALAGEAFLPRDQAASMWAPELGEYGYGWQLLKPSGQTLNRSLVFHAGGLPGVSTDLLRYPDDHVTVVILANLNPVSLPEISRNLSTIVFGQPYVIPPLRQPVKVDPLIYDRYAGEYVINPSLTLTVTRDRDKLVVQATNQPRDIAVPESPTTFFSRISPTRLTFVANARGEVDRLIIHDPARDIIAIRK